MEKELAKLGGKLIEFQSDPNNKAYSQHYKWLIPF